MLASFGWSDFAYLAVAIFMLVAGASFLYAAIRLGGTLRRASSLLQRTEAELLPVVSKLGGTVDRVNVQLDKVDQMTDSAVDAVTTVDTAVRTLSLIVTRPIEKLVGLAAGVRHGVSSLLARGSLSEAVQTAREEAARREQDLADELGREQ
jgi:hypothetical protein